MAEIEGFTSNNFSVGFLLYRMTGLDQDMMQKNLSCRNLKDAQKNMITFSFVLVLLISCSFSWAPYCTFMLMFSKSSSRNIR